VDEATVLERLVSAYSPSGSEGLAVGRFVACATELGYRTRIDRVGNGIAVRGRGRPEVMFLGHIDTVEGRLPVRRSRGAVRGRGVVDAKGALAAALAAGADFSGPGRYTVVAAVGEESDSRGARGLLGRPPPDAVIAGEPSGWDGVTIGYKGDLRVEATFRSWRTHYSSPHPTAADVALAWVAAVREEAASAVGASPFRSLSAKVVGLGFAGKGDQECAAVTVDLRLPPGLSSSELLGRLPKEPGRPNVRVLVRIEPVEVVGPNPVALALEAGIRAEQVRPTVWRKGGTSDLNLVLPRWGCPGVAYGPGDARLDHTSKEVLSLSDLRRSVRVLRYALRELTGTGALSLRRSAAGA
jgi:[amino group carrier protein]-lysine/ornithine hydrolase